MVVQTAGWAFIGTDGRVSRNLADGTRRIIRENQPKMDCLPSDLVLLSTGHSELIERIRAFAKGWLTACGTHDRAYQGLCEALSTAIPEEFADYQTSQPGAKLGVGLCGWDAAAGAVRFVNWAIEDGFQPLEGEDHYNFWVLGPRPSSQAVRQLRDAIAEMLPSLDADGIWEAMRLVLDNVAAEDESVNRNLYRRVVVPPGTEPPELQD
jgi:hypothetical protein